MVDPELTVTEVLIEDGWTMITFVRELDTVDDEDYDLGQVRSLVWCALLLERLVAWRLVLAVMGVGGGG